MPSGPIEMRVADDSAGLAVRSGPHLVAAIQIEAVNAYGGFTSGTRGANDPACCSRLDIAGSMIRGLPGITFWAIGPVMEVHVHRPVSDRRRLRSISPPTVRASESSPACRLARARAATPA